MHSPMYCYLTTAPIFQMVGRPARCIVLTTTTTTTRNHQPWLTPPLFVCCFFLPCTCMSDTNTAVCSSAVLLGMAGCRRARQTTGRWYQLTPSSFSHFFHLSSVFHSTNIFSHSHPQFFRCSLLFCFVSFFERSTVSNSIGPSTGTATRSSKRTNRMYCLLTECFSQQQVEYTHSMVSFLQACTKGGSGFWALERIGSIAPRRMRMGVS